MMNRTIPVLSIAAMVIVAVCAIMMAKLGVAPPAPPPAALDAEPAAAWSVAGHDLETCSVAGQLIAIENSAGQVQPLQKIVVCNPSATVVRIISSNGNAASEGTPICNTSSCVSVCFDTAAGPNIFSCAVAAATLDVNLIGWGI